MRMFLMVSSYEARGAEEAKPRATPGNVCERILWQTTASASADALWVAPGSPAERAVVVAERTVPRKDTAKVREI